VDSLVVFSASIVIENEKVLALSGMGDVVAALAAKLGK